MMALKGRRLLDSGGLLNVISTKEDFAEYYELDDPRWKQLGKEKLYFATGAVQ